MAQMLTDFRNKVCGALLFINILFLVFTIVLKVKSEDMDKLELPVPVSILSFGEAPSYFMSYILQPVLSIPRLQIVARA